jgi:Zn-dependent alcohol dehydrogenase
VSISTRAAVVDKGGADPEIQPIQLSELRHDEVLVRCVATGVCHTDVAWASGELWDNFPVVLGHESSGVVEAVGSAVSRVKPGDRVGVALAHHCGHCRYCESGRPMLCAGRLNDPGRLWRDGQLLIQGFGTGGFSELMIVPEASTLPLPDDVPMDVAAVVGCAVSTGLGAVFNIAEVEYGSTVAIIGAGGIGLSVLMGCVVAGAERIVVGDVKPERLQLARELGATDVVDGSEDSFRDIAADGFNYVFEATGFPEPMNTAIRLAERGGTATIIGAPAPDAEIRINALDFVPSQRRILGCLTGNVRPSVDFDRYFRLYARGRLPLDRLVTSHVALDDIATGFERNRTAQGIRTIVDITEE